MSWQQNDSTNNIHTPTTSNIALFFQDVYTWCICICWNIKCVLVFRLYFQCIFLSHKQTVTSIMKHYDSMYFLTLFHVFSLNVIIIAHSRLYKSPIKLEVKIYSRYFVVAYILCWRRRKLIFTILLLHFLRECFQLFLVSKYMNLKRNYSIASCFFIVVSYLLSYYRMVASICHTWNLNSLLQLISHSLFTFVKTNANKKKQKEKLKITISR